MREGIRASRVPPCPLCHSDAARRIAVVAERRYFHCPSCALIFLDPLLHLSPTEERARYELHRNDGGDAGYVQFLRQLADPMIEQLHPDARGIDVGCGPAPVLASLFTAAGFPCAAYDPYFAPDRALLDGRYDFIACSEVIEHVHEPATFLDHLEHMLASGGLLGLMTRFVDDSVPFETWWYRRDPTHVCFYAEPTMRTIAERRGWSVELPRANVALFTVPRATTVA